MILEPNWEVLFHSNLAFVEYFLGFWRHVLGEWEDYFPFLVGYDMWWYISRMPNIDGLPMSPLHIFSTKPHMMPTNLNQYFPRFGFDSEQNMQPWTWMAFASCFVNYDVGFKHIVSPKAGNLSSTVCDIFELNLIDPNPIDHSFASVRCCKFLVIHEVLTISTVSDVCPSIVGVPKLDWVPWVRCTTPADWTSSQALGGEIVFADICCFSENISWIYDIWIINHAILRKNHFGQKKITVDRLNRFFLSECFWAQHRPAEARMVLALLFLAGHIAWMPRPTEIPWIPSDQIFNSISLNRSHPKH